jgi:EmrB/QacA subfamily drug resistance transporter
VKTVTAAAPTADGARPGGSGSLAGLWGLSFVVILGTIMSIFDTTIVNVALDTLGRSFHTSLSTIQWVSTAYLLALAIVIPLTGWAVERFGAKTMYMTSLVLFIVGSALCGMAWSAGSLIVFRVLQGLGGGMIMPVGQTILARAAGPQRMGRIMTIVGIPMMLGPVLGPVIGGLLVDSLSWRWIFYVNIPIGLLALLLATRKLDNTERVHGGRLDGVGLALLSPGLAFFVYGLSEAGDSGGFSSSKVVFSLVLGVALMVAFCWHALRVRDPLIDLKLFKNRGFTAASGTSFVLGAAIFGAMFLLPLYYQIVRGQDALHAGLLMAPQGIGAMITMPIGGRITDRVGASRIVPVGLLIMLAGTFAYTQVGADTSEVLLAVSLFVRGLGLGLSMMPAMGAAYQTLERSDVPRATTTINIMQRVGGSFGTAALAVVLQRQIASHFGGHVTSLASAANGLPPAAQSAVASSFGTAFWWAMIITALGFIPAMLLPKPPKAVEVQEQPGIFETAEAGIELV